MSGISVNKEGLQTALTSFQSISGEINDTITAIKADLEIIEKNWTGPEHNSAADDRNNAEDNMEKAISTLESMNGAISQLSKNANKISYNG